MSSYVCKFCRLPSDPSGISCPNCGAPINVKEVVSDSGWEEQPSIPDMAKIHFGPSSAQISGTYVPVTDVNLGDGHSVYFSHHVLLWTEPQVNLQAKNMGAGWNRALAGIPLVMMTATGPGHIAFSHDAPGETVAIPLQQGQAVDVREHRFLTATQNVDYSWLASNIYIITGTGDDRETHYPLGQCIDRFHADSGPGLLLLHAPGNTFVRDLTQGQTICIQPSALLYKDPSVGMQLHIEYPAGNNMFGRYSMRTVWLRMWGPGRVAVQSVYEPPEAGGSITGHSQATTQRWS